MKKAMLFFIGLLTMTCSYSNNWDHVYMGTNFGATISNYSDVKFAGRGSVSGTLYPAASNMLSKQKVTEGNAQIDLGIGHSFGHFYIGTNVFTQLSINSDKDFLAKATSGINTTSVKQEMVPNAFAFGLNIQPGIVISPKVLLYSELGFIFQRIGIRTETTLNTQSTPPKFYASSIDQTFWAKGFQYGIGIRYRLNDQMTIKGSFVMTSFGNHNRVLGSTTSPINSGGNTFYVYSSTKLKSAQTFLIGIDYNF